MLRSYCSYGHHPHPRRAPELTGTVRNNDADCPHRDADEDGDDGSGDGDEGDDLCLGILL